MNQFYNRLDTKGEAHIGRSTETRENLDIDGWKVKGSRGSGLWTALNSLWITLRIEITYTIFFSIVPPNLIISYVTYFVRRTVYYT